MHRSATITLVMLALLGTEVARAQDAYFTQRGPYVSVMLSGSEIDGPKPTAATDVGGFTGLGVVAAVGYRWLPLRAEIEYHANTAYGASAWFSGSDDDRVRLRSLMLNGIVDAQLSQWFGLFFGAGFGRANVRADFVSCLEYPVCPSFAESHTSGSANAWQLQLGFTVGPPNRHQFIAGFRRLRSGSLGLTDVQGRPFAGDRADFIFSYAGWRGNF